MPELPEVENLRLGLEKYILGQKILKVEITKPKLVSGKGTIRKASNKKREEFIKGTTHERFMSVDRRAKNLIFRLSHGKVILAHLKMTGQFVYQSKTGKKDILGGHPIEISEKTLPNKHSHIVFTLEKGTLYYNDTRMFGYLLYYPTLKTFENEDHFKMLGKEPLEKDFTVEYFTDSLKNKKSKIKTVLMGQSVVVGVGNIYTDESLFAAHIDPRRNASTLKPNEARDLHKAIVTILRRATKVGGSSVATYRLIDDSRGNYAREHKVYGKGNQDCVLCKTPLKKIQINNRTTVFCSNCQK